MRRLLQWAAIAALLAFALVFGSRPGTPASDADPVAAIASGLRCPVCQGLSVQDSDSPTARDIRADVARRLDEGQTPEEVRRAYTERFGEWILLRPAGRGFTALVWALPAAGAVGGVVIVAAAFWRWHGRRGRAPTADEERLVAAARRAGEPS